MHPIIRNILAVVAGWVGGSFINMSLVGFGHRFFPVEGLDPNDMAALAEAMPDFGPEQFIFPFLAHALGTFSGAAIASVIAANNKMKFALAIGILFLLGGIAVNYLLPAPAWFTAVDLILAYLPMAWLGGKLIGQRFDTSEPVDLDQDVV